MARAHGRRPLVPPSRRTPRSAEVGWRLAPSEQSVRRDRRSAAEGSTSGELTAMARRYRDNGHPQFWGRIIGTTADSRKRRVDDGEVPADRPDRRSRAVFRSAAAVDAEIVERSRCRRAARRWRSTPRSRRIRPSATPRRRTRSRGRLCRHGERGRPEARRAMSAARPSSSTAPTPRRATRRSPTTRSAGSASGAPRRSSSSRAFRATSARSSIR